jgi:hypothetical protein
VNQLLDIVEIANSPVVIGGVCDKCLSSEICVASSGELIDVALFCSFIS